MAGDSQTPPGKNPPMTPNPHPATWIRRAAALALLGTAGLAQAQAGSEQLYVQIDGIKGDVTSPLERKDWIAASGLSWNVQAELSFLKGTGASVGKAQAGTLNWSQGFDSSMNGLYQLAFQGGSAKSVKLEQTRLSANGELLTGLAIQADGAYVTGLSLGMNGLSVSTQPKAITLSVDPQAWLGGDPRKVSATWDLVRNTASATGSTVAVLPSQMDSRQAAATNSTVHAYLRLEDAQGKSLAGSSTAYGYENWIEIDQLAWGVTNSVSLISGTGGVSVGKPSSGLLSWTQAIDATLPLNLVNMVKGRPLTKAVIEYVNVQGDGAPVTFMQQTLKNVYFGDILLSGDTVGEAVGFTQIDQTLWAVDPLTGARGKATGFSYDVLKNKFVLGATITETTAARFGEGLLDGVWANSTLPHDAASSGQIVPAPVVSVPEPDGWALMLAGGTMLAGLARRRGARRS